MNTSNINDKRYSTPFSQELNIFSNIRIKKIIQLIPQCDKLLDIGCWDGYIMEQIKKTAKAKKIIGIDNSKYAVNLGKKKGLDIRLIESADKKIPLHDNEFDCVIAGEIIEHLYDINLFLAEINRILKINGCLIITTPNLASIGARITLLLGKTPWMIENEIGGKNAGHLRYFTFNSLDKILLKHNFLLINAMSEAIQLGNNFVIKNKIITKVLCKLGREIIIKYKKIS